MELLKTPTIPKYVVASSFYMNEIYSKKFSNMEAIRPVHAYVCATFL